MWGKRTHSAHWVGAVFAVGGLYLLSVQKGLTISTYDLIVLAGAFVCGQGMSIWLPGMQLRWGRFGFRSFQFAICGLLSAAAALIFETVTFSQVLDGIGPILYGGFLSVGVAYTLQVVAQRRADPSHAVIILSLEGAFAALGGWLVLEETLSLRSLVGCALMIAGTLISQIVGRKVENTSS